MKKGVLLVVSLAFVLLVGISSAQSGDYQDNSLVTFSANPEISFDGTNINIYIPEGFSGAGFNLTATYADWGYNGEFRKYFASVNSHINYFIYDNKEYRGLISGNSEFAGFDNDGLKIYEFNVNMLFVDSSKFDGNSENFVTGSFYLRMKINTTATIEPAENGHYIKGGFYINREEETLNDIEQRISALESWKQTIEDWKETISNIISEFTLSITELVTKTNDYETRISNLENQNISQPNITISDYWKYMKSSDRKNIVCGIAKDNHLTTLTMQELGYRCDVTYRQTSRGESASCRCDKI